LQNGQTRAGNWSRKWGKEKNKDESPCMVLENSGPNNAWIFGLSTVVYGDIKLSKPTK
jgi:hypothetical protein